MPLLYDCVFGVRETVEECLRDTNLNVINVLRSIEDPVLDFLFKHYQKEGVFTLLSAGYNYDWKPYARFLMIFGDDQELNNGVCQVTVDLNPKNKRGKIRSYKLAKKGVSGSVEEWVNKMVDKYRELRGPADLRDFEKFCPHLEKGKYYLCISGRDGKSQIYVNDEGKFYFGLPRFIKAGSS